MARFWVLHAVVPGAAFLAIIAVLLGTGLDGPLARAWAYDPLHGWLGAGTWWANDLIHRLGRDLMRAVAAAALGTWLASRWLPRLQSWRGDALFILFGIVLGTALAGLLKSLTNVDCPWNLEGFGGTRPYLALWADRPDAWPVARCFPGAHAASGFTLMGFYFVLRERRPLAARWALAGGGSMGAVFAFGQEARGAHFLSHDLTSAALVWYVLLGLYAARTAAGSRSRNAGIRTSPTGRAS